MSARDRGSDGTHAERQADMLGLTLPQLQLLQAVDRQALVRPGPRVMSVMEALTQRGLVDLRTWGRYVITAGGRAALRKPVRTPPVFLTDGGSLKFTTRPDGRWIVDDGIPDHERGYSTAHLYETDGGLEARGLTTNPARRSRTSGGDVNEAIWQDPDELSWTWQHDADARHRKAQTRRARASRLRRIGGEIG